MSQTNQFIRQYKSIYYPTRDYSGIKKIILVFHNQMGHGLCQIQAQMVI